MMLHYNEKQESLKNQEKKLTSFDCTMVIKVDSNNVEMMSLPEMCILQLRNT